MHCSGDSVRVVGLIEAGALLLRLRCLLSGSGTRRDACSSPAVRGSQCKVTSMVLSLSVCAVVSHPRDGAPVRDGGGVEHCVLQRSLSLFEEA